LGLRDEVMAGKPAQPANASAPADPDARRKFLLENIVLIL
jgi:predicted secreted protein